MYPENWPRCPSCGDYAMDGHITCGRVQCGEAAQRDGPKCDIRDTCKGSNGHTGPCR